MFSMHSKPLVPSLSQLEYRFGADEPVGPWAHRLVDEFYGEDAEGGDDGDMSMAAPVGGGVPGFGFGTAPPGSPGIAVDASSGASMAWSGIGPSSGLNSSLSGGVGRGSPAAVLPAWMAAQGGR